MYQCLTFLLKISFPPSQLFELLQDYKTIGDYILVFNEFVVSQQLIY